MPVHAASPHLPSLETSDIPQAALFQYRRQVGFGDVGGEGTVAEDHGGFAGRCECVVPVYVPTIPLVAPVLWNNIAASCPEGLPGRIALSALLVAGPSQVSPRESAPSSRTSQLRQQLWFGDSTGGASPFPRARSRTPFAMHSHYPDACSSSGYGRHITRSVHVAGTSEDTGPRLAVYVYSAISGVARQQASPACLLQFVPPNWALFHVIPPSAT